MMDFTFPEVEDEVWKDQLSKTHSIRDFQLILFINLFKEF